MLCILDKGAVECIYFIKADMNNDIPMETTSIFFLANVYLNQGIDSGYVKVSFVCEGLIELQGTRVFCNHYFCFCNL